MPRSFCAALSRRLAPIFACGLAVAGCRQARVETYRIPKEHEAGMTTAPVAAETPAAMPAAADAPHPAMGTTAPLAVATDAGLAWTAPAGWQPKALGAMRKGSFTVAGPDGATGDLSITAFPGAVGGELANVNRWRGQVNLAPLAAADLADATARVTAGALVFTFVDLVATGDHPTRILGAMTPYGDAMWFFKLTGPDAAVAAHRAEFLAFLQTVHPAAAAAP